MNMIHPCPHCGPYQSMVDSTQCDVSNRWQVFCGRCGSSSGSCKTEEDARDLWNKRNSVELYIGKTALTNIFRKADDPEMVIKLAADGLERLLDLT